MYHDRTKKIEEFVSELECDAIISFRPENIFYFTGFWGEGVLIIKDNKRQLFVPKLEYNRAQNDSKECDIVLSERGSDLLKSIVKEISNIKKSCTDCKDYETIENINTNIGQNCLKVDQNPFYKSRIIKDEFELDMISKASNIIDQLFSICTEEIKTGVTETELQSILIYEAMKRGASLPNYEMTLNPFIIASGSNGAFPHANVSNREFERGDFVVVDLTIKYNGYVSDATRTFAVSNINKEMKEIYNIVKQSQQLGLETIQENISCDVIDKTCRDHISLNKYGEYFTHSTGHGIGLEVHEPPWIRKTNSDVLKNNMTITIEPGIYIPNKFGVRIEDSIIINNNNFRFTNLHKFSKELIIIN